ncbi:hypothetical protein [Salinicoccus albus]|uniref:hypothetical protein n=1 Tax=Salinicoccus albus TaxID=418756 RepID=UPI000379602E|nr:hypothetical protein [Salinicoccus albus]
MEEALNLEDILEVIRENWWWIISLMLRFGAIVAFATAFFNDAAIRSKYWSARMK